MAHRLCRRILHDGILRRRRPHGPTGPSWSNCGSSSRFRPGHQPETGSGGSRPPPSQLADPALAARLLGVDAGALVDGVAGSPPIPREGTLLGALFQSLVTLSARTYAQANEARVGHLRTRGGEHEIDIIIERRDGRIVAVEVKLSATVDDADTRHLKWLADRLGPDLLDAAVITTGSEAYRRADGIGVIPAGLLTA